ncbi:Ankyrin repeat domain-containing protein 27 [Morella rubra]|uniref:Ankyrin repeat domain-containing protein 27 n=1 Tax=Morella rubra TaxID=262757 RepID=A0A6A1VSX6_9ROSI|nr:Ankyrin repeat domain-containing protein 27 [Morella rubra]
MSFTCLRVLASSSYNLQGESEFSRSTKLAQRAEEQGVLQRLNAERVCLDYYIRVVRVKQLGLLVSESLFVRKHWVLILPNSDTHPEVLDYINMIPFVDTPLHAASSAGQTRFAKIRPSFTRKINQDGLTPMHPALQYDHIPLLRQMGHRYDRWQFRPVPRFLGAGAKQLVHSNRGKSGWGLISSLAQQENSLINPSCDSSQFQHLKLRKRPINCLPLHGMDQSLKDAAEQVDIEFLYSSIRSDPKVLANIDQIPFVDTPLHAAAAGGQTLFAMEIMTLKSSFARKLNPDGFTPMHLALQHNQSEVVLRLLYVVKDLVRIRRKGGATPFHCAAKIGNVDALTEFLKACPDSITDFTNRRETALPRWSVTAATDPL